MLVDGWDYNSLSHKPGVGGFALVYLLTEVVYETILSQLRCSQLSV